MIAYRNFVLSILLIPAHLGCVTVEDTSSANTRSLQASPVTIPMKAIEYDIVELPDNGEWWVFDGYKPEPFKPLWHRFFYDDICHPDVKIIATVRTPVPHPFIREDINEVERARILRSLGDGARVVTFNLKPVTLDELETEFLANALPRAKREPSYTCNDLY